MYDIAQKVDEIATLNVRLHLLGEELTTVETSALTKMITDINPVMPFISDKLVTGNIDNLNDGFIVRTSTTYFEHQGICLYKSYTSESIDEHQIKLAGHRLVYCTNQKLYMFERDGLEDTSEGFRTVNYTCKVSEATIEDIVSSFDVEDIITTVRDLLHNVVRELESEESTKTKLIARLKKYLESSN